MLALFPIFLCIPLASYKALWEWCWLGTVPSHSFSRFILGRLALVISCNFWCYTQTEHWDSRFNAFILPIGLLTITLEDVVKLTGLRVSGHPMEGTMEVGLRQMVAEMLGETTLIWGNTIKLEVLLSHFG